MFVHLSPLYWAVFTSPGPEIFRIGSVVIRWYGVLIAAAIVLGLQLSQRLATYRRIKPDDISDLAIWLVIGAIPCARLYYVLFQWDYYSQHLDQVATIWRGGIAIHGAILGGMLAAVIFSRLNQISFWQLADLVAPSLILGQAIGRWGNFFNSEAFGDPTDLPWKLFIPPARRPLAYRSSAYFHPTFLYESVWNLMVLGILLAVFFKFPKAKKGTIFLVYTVTYSLGRLWIEGLRTDSLMLGPLRIAQVVSLIGIGIGMLGLSWLYLLKRSLPDTKQAS